MADKALMEKLDKAMLVINDLSRDAKAAGESELMYAANRAWHQLFDVRSARSRSQPEKR